MGKIKRIVQARLRATAREQGGPQSPRAAAFRITTPLGPCVNRIAKRHPRILVDLAGVERILPGAMARIRSLLIAKVPNSPSAPRHYYQGGRVIFFKRLRQFARGSAVR